MTQQFKLPDERNLDYVVSGAKHGFPLLWIHGTPGSLIPLPSLVAACEKKRLKLITFSRAGYGASTRKKGRQIVDDVADVLALTQHLGVDRCFVGGWSSGGPHALACAARLPNCVAALCVAGGGPYDAEDLDYIAGQGEDNVNEFNAAMRGEDDLQSFCAAERTEMLNGNVDDLVEAMSSILPDIDKEAMKTVPELGQFVFDSFQEGLKSGVCGWVDDTISCLKPWGFELSEIKVPVLLYQGSDDMMVPYAHGEWLAKHLPQEKLRKHLLQGQGHISIFIGREESMLDELLDTKE